LIPPRTFVRVGREKTARTAPSFGTKVHQERDGMRSRGYLGGRRMGMLVTGCEQPFERRLPAEGTAALVDVGAELVAELGHVRRHRQGGRVPQRAEALAEDPVADVEQ